MNELLEQISIMKSIFKKYNIEAASIFGSRLFGTNNEFSDLDVVVVSEKLVISINKNINLLRQLKEQYLVPEAYINILLSPMIDEIKRKILLDVNIMPEYDYDKYFNSTVYQNKIELIKDNKVVKQNEIKKEIIKIRKKGYEKPVYDDKAQKYSLYIGLAYVASCLRHYDSIKTEKKFLKPKQKWFIASRNAIVSDISYFVQLVDKVDEKYFRKVGVDYLFAQEINNLVKSKKKEYKNYNTSSLSWINCPKSIYEQDDLKLFWTFLVQHSELSRRIMNESDKPDYIHIRNQYTYFLDDKAGFNKVMAQKYLEYMNEAVFDNQSKEYINAIKKIYKNYSLLKRIRVTQNSLKLLSRCLEDYSSYLNKRSEVDIFADIKAMHLKNLSENVLSNFREVDDKNCYIYLFEKEIEHTIECLKNVNKKKFSKSEVEELYEVLSTLLEITL